MAEYTYGGETKKIPEGEEGTKSQIEVGGKNITIYHGGREAYEEAQEQAEPSPEPSGGSGGGGSGGGGGGSEGTTTTSQNQNKEMVEMVNEQGRTTIFPSGEVSGRKERGWSKTDKTFKSKKAYRKKAYTTTESGAAKKKESFAEKEKERGQKKLIEEYEKKQGEIKVPQSVKSDIKKRGMSHSEYKEKLQDLKTQQIRRSQGFVPGIVSSEKRSEIPEGGMAHSEYSRSLGGMRAGTKPAKTERFRLTRLETTEKQAEATAQETESMIRQVENQKAGRYEYMIPEKGKVSKQKYLDYLKDIQRRAQKQAKKSEASQEKVQEEVNRIQTLRSKGYEYVGVEGGGNLKFRKPKEPKTTLLPVSTEKPGTEPIGISEEDVQSFFENYLGAPDRKKPSAGAEITESLIETGFSFIPIAEGYAFGGTEGGLKEARKLIGEQQEFSQEIKGLPIQKMGTNFGKKLWGIPKKKTEMTHLQKQQVEGFERSGEVMEEAIFSKVSDLASIPGYVTADVGYAARNPKKIPETFEKGGKELYEYFESNPKEAKAEFIEEVGMPIGAGAVVPTAALSSISSPVHTVNVKTKVGTQTAWRGVSVKGNPLIGKTPSGVTVGKPSAKQMNLQDVEFGGWRPGPSEVEAKTVGRSEVLEKAGIPEEEIQKIETGKQVMTQTEKQPSAFMSEKFIRETKSLTGEQVNAAISYAKKKGGNVEQIYGTFGTRPQMKPEYVVREPGDIDVQLSTESEQQAQEFAQELVQKLEKKGGRDVRVSPEKKTLIESRGEGGEWHHAVDINYKGEEQDIMGPDTEGAWGFEFGQKSVNVEGLSAMSLSEHGLRKGGSALTLKGKEVKPKPHREKDVQDFYWTQRTLLESQGMEPRVAKEQLEPWKSAWEDVDFEQPTEMRIPLKQPSQDVSPSTFPSTSVSTSPSPSLTPSPSPSISPSPSPSLMPSVSPSIWPSISPSPSVSPSVSPSPSPSPSPSLTPSIIEEPSIVPGGFPGFEFPESDFTTESGQKPQAERPTQQFKPSVTGLLVGEETEEPQTATGFGIRLPKNTEKENTEKEEEGLLERL